MKQKLIPLLLFLMVFVMGAQATRTLIAKVEISSGAISATSGTLYGSSAISGIQSSGKIGGDAAYVAITLSNGNYFRVGDEIEVEVSKQVQIFEGGKGSGGSASATPLLTITSGSNGVYSATIGAITANTNTISVGRTTSAYNGNITSFAIYRDISDEAFTVSFDAGEHGTYTGGDIKEASAGAGITLPSLNTIDDNYVFNGWYTAATDGTKAGDAGDAYAPTESTTLYAQYSAYSAPTIGVESANVETYTGIGVTLEATVGGAPTPTVKWYQSSSDVATGGTEVGTGVTYQPDVTTTGTYYYYAVASNSEGEATSEVVTLNVVSPDKVATDNAYYLSAGEAVINGEQIVGDDITMTFTYNGSDMLLGTAVSDNNVNSVNANMVASVNPGSANNWSTDFVATKDGTLSVGVVINGGKDFSVTNVESFKYSSSSISSATVNASGTDVDKTSWKPSDKTYCVVTIDVTAGTTYKFSVSGSKMGFYGFEFQPKADRTFTDFKIDFRTNPYTTILPTSGELPEGVEVTVPSYNGAQHGAQGATTIVVPVDGPVKFTIGNCQYSTKMTVKNSSNETIAEVANNGSCENSVSDISSATYNSYATYTYNSEEANTLTFTLNGYLPYFFAEACDYIANCTVKYYDVDGELITTDEVEGGSSLAYNAEAAAAVTVADGYAFRGWFNGTGSSATKVAEGTVITDDLKLYAKATEIEVPEVGKVFDYDLRQQYFYAEDHEAFSATGYSYNGSQHGWAFSSGKSFSVQVAGNAQIVVGLCAYAADAPITVTDADNNEVGTIASAKVTTDGATSSFNYTGEATTLTFTMGGTAYIHGVKVYNVSSIPTKDEATGYYMVSAGDAAGLVLALNAASAEGNAKVFLPNGTYDLGTTTLTTISGNNVSVIGESRDGVIIKNRPVQEGIAITATILNTGSDNYFQDLTLDCIAPYGTGSDTKSAERGVCLQDKGTQTICKNVYLKGLQDTYYSNNTSGTYYFEDSKIEGTVDFLCGNGDVYFNNTLLKVVARSTGSGSANVIAAPNTPKSFGYIFYDCTIDGISAQDNVYRLGRPWADNTIIRMINTTMMIKPVSTGWDEWSSDVNKQHYVQQFAEYNSVDEKGNAVSLNSRLTTIGGQPNNPEITEAEAASYTKEAVFGSSSWIPYEIAAQETVVKTSVVNNVVTVPEGIYLVEKDGNFVEIFNGTSYTYDNSGSYTLRKANARGGFGEAVSMIAGAAAPEQTGDVITLTVTANMKGNRAYVNTESNYTVSDDTEVYLPVSKTSGEVNLEKVDASVIAANYPVVLKAKNANLDGTYTITLTQTTDAASDLSGYTQYLNTTVEGTPVAGYRLGYKASSGIKFYKYVASAPEAGKIYLNLADLPEDNSNTGNYLKIAFEQEATGINEVNAVDAGSVNGKFVKNGKLIIIKNGKSYNAAGAVLE